MTHIAFNGGYVTQEQLSCAWRRLGHRSAPVPQWSATLLINKGLEMFWACRVLEPPEVREEYPARYEWHVIARAGELDWPPLKPESEIWPALLEQQPVPTGDLAERQARMLGKTVVQMHRDTLRQHFLSDAHIGGLKRNPTDVNFSPIVRDWDATARDLAAFIDANRPPKLTAEQRVMEQGVRLAELEAAVETTKASLAHLMRNAAREQGDNPRYRFKADLVRWSGKTAPTVKGWLSGGSYCEGSFSDEDGIRYGTGHGHLDEGHAR
ncbi:hypothetical protein ACFV42_49600 [Streptomyces solisilvae]|uniref:hypothetical protein n=1 Tax=Streptomyces malaysiensis TaxID=92644 RepID=UPI0036A3238F